MRVRAQIIPARSATVLHARLSMWKDDGLRAQERVQTRTLHNLIEKIVYDTHALCRCIRTRFFSPSLRAVDKLRLFEDPLLCAPVS